MAFGFSTSLVNKAKGILGSTIVAAEGALSKIKRIFGLPSGAVQQGTVVIGRQLTRTGTGRGEVNAILSDAIKFRQPVRFVYSDKWVPSDPADQLGAKGTRVGDPCAMWIGFNGGQYLHMYIDPESVSLSNTLVRAGKRSSGGEKPGWRTFLVERIGFIELLSNGIDAKGKPIPFTTPPGWNPSWYSRKGGYALRLLGD
jgi:hypothetical protein